MLEEVPPVTVEYVAGPVKAPATGIAKYTLHLEPPGGTRVAG
ncbi:hypothetical protein [Streptomyces sp. MAR4 CNX-425]